MSDDDLAAAVVPIRLALAGRHRAEQRVIEAVSAARAVGMTWGRVGAAAGGICADTARSRYAPGLEDRRRVHRERARKRAAARAAGV